MLEIYATEIQMYSEQKEGKKMKVGPPSRSVIDRFNPYALPLITSYMYVYGVRNQAVYEATLRVKSSMPHPRIMGIIRECGGKMWMSERK